MSLVSLKRRGHFKSISVLYGDRWRIHQTGHKTDRQTTHRTKHLKKTLKNFSKRMSQRYQSGQKKKPLENYDSLTVVQKKAPSNLLNFTWYSVSENVEEPWSREMTTVPSSTCQLNIASLDGVYLSCMFCAFPKPLRKRSGFCLRVTSNDNLFAVICVQTTGDIQNSDTVIQYQVS